MKHYWLLDPIEKTLEVFAWVNGRWHEVDTFEGAGTVRAVPFEAVELELGSLWAW